MSDSVRVDRWLWAARQFKTRALAQRACESAHVEVNGVAPKPSRPLKIGDQLEVSTPGGRRRLQVVALSEVRGPAPVARLLYNDHTPEEWKAPATTLEQRLSRPRPTGRPDKRGRRQARAFKHG